MIKRTNQHPRHLARKWLKNKHNSSAEQQAIKAIVNRTGPGSLAHDLAKTPLL